MVSVVPVVANQIDETGHSLGGVGVGAIQLGEHSVDQGQHGQEGEDALGNIDPGEIWDEFEPWLYNRTSIEVVRNHELLQQRAGELVDGGDLDGQDCLSIGRGFTGGDLGCNATCDAWDESQCTRCGDGQAEGDGQHHHHGSADGPEGIVSCPELVS